MGIEQLCDECLEVVCECETASHTHPPSGKVIGWELMSAGAILGVSDGKDYTTVEESKKEPGYEDENVMLLVRDGKVWLGAEGDDELVHIDPKAAIRVLKEAILEIARQEEEGIPF